MHEVGRAGVPPVHEFARVLGRVLEEGVVGAGVDDQPVRVVEAPHRRGDVEDGVVGGGRSPRGGHGVLGECGEVLGHIPQGSSDRGLMALVRDNLWSVPRPASVEVGDEQPQAEERDGHDAQDEEPGRDLRGVQALDLTRPALEVDLAQQAYRRGADDQDE